MSATAVSLENVLARHETGRINLDNLNADDLKPAARFWFGPAAHKFRKAECIQALTGLFRDRARLETRLRSLPDNEREVLAVFKRYGGAMSGALVQTELMSRGLIQKMAPHERFYGSRRKDDLVHNLSAKLLLIAPSGGYSRYGYFYSSFHRRYPDLVAAPGILDLVAPAASWIWRSSAPASAPTVASQRSPAEVALDVWLMLQVPQPQACAMIRTSRQFRPLLAGQVPPDWFIVRPVQLAEVERLLAELGFSVGSAFQLHEVSEDQSAARISSSSKRRAGRRARSDD